MKNSSNHDPLTFHSMVEAFRKLGIREGDTLLVHSSLKSLGWICGGAVSVIEALLHVLGAPELGTLVMPTHTGDNTDPSRWENPPVSIHWWETIQAHSPAFDPDKTPTFRMGLLPETFRRWPGCRRSPHPIGSFAALGKHAEFLSRPHPLEPMFGEDSPIGRIYQLNGKVLLLGVGHERNTSLHLAEYRADFPGKRMIQEGCSMFVEGRREWVRFEMQALDTDDFELLGGSFEAKWPSEVGRCRFGKGMARLFSQRELVDFAVEWMEEFRS